MIASLPGSPFCCAELHDVLMPEGAMHLMVYAPYGCAGVYLLQDHCRRLGIGTTAAEIRELAASLRAPAGYDPIVFDTSLQPGRGPNGVTHS